MLSFWWEMMLYVVDVETGVDVDVVVVLDVDVVVVVDVGFVVVVVVFDVVTMISDPSPSVASVAVDVAESVVDAVVAGSGY